MTNKKKLPPIAYIGMAGVILGTGYVGSKTLLNSTGNSTVEVRSYGNEEKQITVLGDTFSGYSTFRTSTFGEKISKANLGIQYRNEFDQAARAAALGQNADIIVTTLDQFLLHQPRGQIVGLIDKTIGADAVVLNTKEYPELKSLKDIPKLTNKTPKIVYSADTPSEYLAKVLDIKFEEFSLGDFEIIEVAESTEAYEKLQSDSDVAIAVLWEPFVSQAKQDGDTVVLSSKDVPNSIVDVIVASDKMLNKPTELSTFLTNYYQHVDGLVQNSTKMNRQIAEDGGLKPQEAGNIATGIDFFSSIESKQWMSDGTLAQRIDATAGILNLTGDMNTFPDDPSRLFSTRYIDQAVSNSERIIASIESADPELAKILRGEKVSTPPAQSKQTIQAASNVGNLSVRGEVSFSAGSALLTPASEQTLTKLATELKDFNQTTTAINIVGHTSQTGAASLNQKLSQQRAQVVANYLKAKGVQLQIVAEGKGFSSPLPGVSPTSPSNQRTEIQLKRIGE